MSGGYFDYKQFQLEDMADSIDRLIAGNGEPDECGFMNNYPPDIIEKFEETAHTLRRAYEMVMRVDWLVSADDGEEAFRARWEKEVRDPENS